MKRITAFILLLWMMLWATAGVWSAVARVPVIQGVTGGTPVNVAVTNSTGNTSLEGTVNGGNTVLSVKLRSGDNLTSPDVLSTNSDPVYKYHGALAVESFGLVYDPAAAGDNSFSFSRTANAAATTTGTGLLGTGMLVWDGTNWQKFQGDAPNSFANLAAAATTTVKSGAGVLHTVTINTLGAADTATLYDNTAGSGTKIATINTAVSQGTLTFDARFSTGLTVVIAGGTPPDLTITYQ